MYTNFKTQYWIYFSFIIITMTISLAITVVDSPPLPYCHCYQSIYFSFFQFLIFLPRDCPSWSEAVSGEMRNPKNYHNFYCHRYWHYPTKSPIITCTTEWVRSNPKARQTKSKARLDRYEEMLSTPAREQMAHSTSIYIPPGPRLGMLWFI